MTRAQEHTLDKVVNAQKRGEARGITSICSAHPAVLEAAFCQAREKNGEVLVESTCNQVNQYGGYTGMKPARFVAALRDMAERLDFPPERLILGGDHLGPNVWQDESAESAMVKSCQLVRDYVAAGYCKIHLDPSMKLRDDPPGRLPIEVIARRSALMARAAENAFVERGSGRTPRYVIGTEVPIPGGIQDQEEGLEISSMEDTRETLEATQRAFVDLGLEAAWARVLAVVVQPGVEFGLNFVVDYDRAQAGELSRFIESQPLVYEAHSTDYQLPGALRTMVEDHFAILKVGPALTFAYREVLFGLAMIEDWIIPVDQRSDLMGVLERAMLAQPGDWEKHYHGDEAAQALARKFSFSDRSRYYWPNPAIQAAVQKLLANLGEKPMPLTLLSQYLPDQYQKIRAGCIPNEPRAMIEERVLGVLDVYQSAVEPG